MSVDKEVTKDLMEVLDDGSEGFAHAAEKLANSDRPGIALKFQSYSDQRSKFFHELDTMALAYGDSIDESGSVQAVAHRMWISVKDIVSGSDPSGVLEAAEQGEEKAVESYQEALGKEISPELRITVQRQFDEVKKARADVKALRIAEAG